MKNILIICLLLGFSNAVLAQVSIQKGFYASVQLNMYNAWEEVISSDGKYNFSHSTKSSSNGFLTQSLGKYGAGIGIGYRQNINNSNNKNILTIDGQYYFNYQNFVLESQFDDLVVKTKVNYNHGFRISLGHHFGKIHPYIFIQGIFQNVTPGVNLIESNGVVYDVADNKKILDSKLTDGDNTFSTFTGSFIGGGGFGIEVPLKEKIVFDIHYIPYKHVEYGLKDINDGTKYFVNGLAITTVKIGVKFFPFIHKKL